MLYMHIVQLLKHYKTVHAYQNKFNITTNEAKANSTVKIEIKIKFSR